MKFVKFIETISPLELCWYPVSLNEWSLPLLVTPFKQFLTSDAMLRHFRYLLKYSDSGGYKSCSAGGILCARRIFCAPLKDFAPLKNPYFDKITD